MQTTNKLLFAALTIATLMPLAALAQSYPNQGYWVDGAGKIITSSTSGECWHTREWTPALAVEPCDPVIKRMAAAAPVMEVAPTPAAPMPAPLPMVAPVSQKTSFSADALFAFDKSVLKPEGKTMLNDLAMQLKGVNYDMVTVTGHADRIGRAAYNQKLSERRANEVKNYLIGQNVPAAGINATGMGETQPVTKAGDCVGPKSAKLIACLQPDRRVDVEMTGTK